MFAYLGRFISKFWAFLLIAWVVVAVEGWRRAPNWDDVTRSGEVEFLPKDVPSRKAEKLFQDAFPLKHYPSNIAVVLSRQHRELTADDRRFIDKVLVPGIRKLADEDNSPIETIHTPDEEGVGALLVSGDNKAALVVTELNTPFQDSKNVPLLKKVEELVESLRSKAPSGLELSLAGSATAGRDLDFAEAQSAKAIETWTIAVVVFLLVFLYRAPLVALIPLITVAIAVEVAISILAMLAQKGIFSPSRDLRVFVTVLMYGGGVDYCLFLIARYREELDSGATPADAMARTVERVGGAIVASAGTVICGIGMLASARFGKMHEAGLVIPLALTIALLATLTFAAPLLRWAGRVSFWPQAVGDGHVVRAPGILKRLASGEMIPNNFWERVGPTLLDRAGTVWVATSLVLVPFALIAVVHYHDQSFNPLGDLPKDMPSRVGSQVLEKHFAPGMLGPLTVVVKNDRVDFTTPEGFELVKQLTTGLAAKKGQLYLADVRSLAEPLGITDVAAERFAHLKKDKANADELIREQAVNHYISPAAEFGNHVMRLDLTFSVDPLGPEGIRRLHQLEAAFRSLMPEGLKASEVAFIGATPSLRDLSDIKQADQRVIEVLVSVVVLILLLIVLQRLVLSVYLVVSVLFSYLATLGIAYLLFAMLGGAEFVGLDWKVPIFLFTILVAVGEDYNIFLLTRVKEEQNELGPEKGLLVALGKTGQVISSCGFVMAGTFASLLSSPLGAMKQLGFALSLGVIIDTLIVRPILVPTFMVLLIRLFPNRWGRFMALGKWEPAAAAEPPVPTGAS